MRIPRRFPFIPTGTSIVLGFYTSGHWTENTALPSMAPRKKACHCRAAMAACPTLGHNDIPDSK